MNRTVGSDSGHPARHRSRVAAVLAAVLAAGALAACSTIAHPIPGSTPTVVRPAPSGVRELPAGTSASPGAGPSGTAVPNCDPRASLRPAGALPPPGHMPAGSTMDRIARRGQLVVGVDQNTYLFGYRDPASGEIVGFDIDILHEVARAIFGDPSRIQFTAITAAQRIPALQGGQVDIVADTMTITCQRLTQVNFSTEYYSAGQRVLVRRDSTARGIDDLGGKKVCAATGSTSIQNIAAAKSHPVPVAVNDWTDCLVLLQQGQVDAISTDDTILLGMAKQDPNTRLVGDAFTAEPYGLAMPLAATDFVRFVNGVLDRIRGDGTWRAIYARWLNPPVPAPPPARYRD